MAETSIEWSDAVWNPVRGCDKISPGCKNCYAETFAERWRGVKGHPYEQGFDLRLVPEKIEEPLRWKKPRRIFVNSMSDLFHKDVPDYFVQRVVRVMEMCPQHTFQILTKRAARLPVFFGNWTPLPNVWLGVSVENQAAADERIPLLLETPAAVRFLSVEPLLGPVNLCAVPDKKTRPAMHHPRYSPLADLDWVIVGGESGPGARRCDVAWVRSVVEQCRDAGVPCFVKQLGTKSIEDLHAGPFPLTGARRLHADRKGGDPDEWPADLRIREFPR